MIPRLKEQYDTEIRDQLKEQLELFDEVLTVFSDLSSIEDRMRGLKMHIPQQGVRVKLIPTEEELEECRSFGRQIAEVLMGKSQKKDVIDFADLA